MYLIRYTDESGYRKSYMNIGFDSLEKAKNELRRIKEYQNKMKGLGYYINRHGNYQFNKACLGGKNWKIKKK